VTGAEQHVYAAVTCTVRQGGNRWATRRPGGSLRHPTDPAGQSL